MSTFLKTIAKPFVKPSAEVLAQQSLEEAKRQLLAYQSAMEHATNMVRYYEQSVKRLSAYVKATTLGEA